MVWFRSSVVSFGDEQCKVAWAFRPKTTYDQNHLTLVFAH